MAFTHLVTSLGTSISDYTMSPGLNPGRGTDSNLSTTGDYISKSAGPMQSPPKPPKFASKEQEREWLKFRLAQAFRVFAHHRFDDGVAGHITARDPINPNAFWVNPLGIHFSLITPDLLLLVDHNGRMLDESGPIRNLNRAAFMIHSALHATRPDVLCAAHSHSMYGRAFSTLGKPLAMLTQNDCVFYEDHVLYDQFNGIVLDEEEGHNIAQALGPHKKAVILQNHGLITLSSTIEGAVHLFIRLEESCRCQLLAYSNGINPVPVSEEESRNTHEAIGKHTNAWFSGLTEFSQLEAKENGAFGVWNGPTTTMKPVTTN